MDTVAIILHNTTAPHDYMAKFEELTGQAPLDLKGSFMGFDQLCQLKVAYKVGWLEASGASDEQTLEEIFQWDNLGHRPRNAALRRSLSVGDVVILVRKRTYPGQPQRIVGYAVAHMGFEQIEAEQVMMALVED